MIERQPLIQAGYLAEKVVRARQVAALPVSPFAIAEAEEIEVMAKPVTAEGVSGMLLRLGETFGIAYATHIDNRGFQRFSVAHELGHYFLPGHIDAVLGENGVHESRAGFASPDRYELEADHFAASLLMPTHLFFAAMPGAGEGLDALTRLSDLCQTSLTATAIRYTQCSRDPVAVVLSTGHRVNFCVMSDSLKSHRDIDWIRKGEAVPKNTLTHTFNLDPKRVRNAERDIARINIQDWYSTRLRTDLCEEVIGLGSYGRTLTMLWDIDVPDPDDNDDDDDDEDKLIESWTPRFRR